MTLTTAQLIHIKNKSYERYNSRTDKIACQIRLPFVYEQRFKASDKDAEV